MLAGQCTSSTHHCSRMHMQSQPGLASTALSQARAHTACHCIALLLLHPPSPPHTCMNPNTYIPTIATLFLHAFIHV